MKLKSALKCALLMATLAACAAPTVPTPTPATIAPLPAVTPIPALVLINGTLIDGTGADPIKDAVLVIQGERILAVGPRRSIRIPESAKIIDVQGTTLLPGFFNAHVHGAYNEEKLATWAKEGVTTVRDLVKARQGRSAQLTPDVRSEIIAAIEAKYPGYVPVAAIPDALGIGASVGTGTTWGDGVTSAG